MLEIVVRLRVYLNMYQRRRAQLGRGPVFLVAGFVDINRPAHAATVFAVGADALKVFGVARLKMIV
jgi:hypothetical protein